MKTRGVLLANTQGSESADRKGDTIINFLISAIAKRGYSHRDIELKSGVSPSGLWRIRQGEDVRLSTLRRIAEALDMSVSELLDGGPPEPQPSTPLSVYCCPVCQGRRVLPTGLYNGTSPIMTPCTVCGGTGVLWR